MLKVIGFSACSDMVATAIVFEISRLCQMYTFPDPNDELSICPYNGPQPPIPAILSIHLLHEFILN